jgi:hypothetical protein
MYDQMTIDDAVNIVRVMSDVLAHDGDEDVRELVAAAKHLVRHIEEQSRELERERARRRGTEERHGSHLPDGAPLIEGADGGGRRDFLASRPVHAGEVLYLLTCAGWHAVRYESNMPHGQPVLYLPLPGVREDIPLAAPCDARFVWPEELRLATQ